MKRREFMKTASLAAVSLRAGFGSAPAARQPRFLSGCCAYSYGSYLKKGQMTMEDFILKAVELGVQGVDITTYWLASTDPGYLTKLRLALVSIISSARNRSAFSA